MQEICTKYKRAFLLLTLPTQEAAVQEILRRVKNDGRMEKNIRYYRGRQRIGNIGNGKVMFEQVTLGV